MAPKVTFPAHTQARMAAAKAEKELKQPKKPATDQPGSAAAPPTLPGQVVGLSVDARQAILKCDAKVIIGYITHEGFVPQAKDVNLAMLNHYIPHIVANYKHPTRTAIGDIIILPDNMNRATWRGVNYVVANMKREIESGSFAINNFTKHKNHLTCMVRPCRDPVDMIHGLNTLRAFGIGANDIQFLTMADGPIMTGLERRANEWTGDLLGLKQFLNTVDQKVLVLLGVEEDRHLLDRAWAVYAKRLQDQPRPKPTGGKASGFQKSAKS